MLELRLSFDLCTKAVREYKNGFYKPVTPSAHNLSGFKRDFFEKKLPRFDLRGCLGTHISKYGYSIVTTSPGAFRPHLIIDGSTSIRLYRS